MHITIIAVGSLGDVQPYVALGLGLKSAGHHVQIATHSNFREFVENQGLGFAEVEGNPRQWLDTETGLDWIESGVGLLGFYRGLKKFMAPVLETLLPTSFTACQDTDLILYSSLAFSGPHIGEKLRRPSFPVMLQPVYPTGQFPSVLVYSRKKTGPLYNRLTHFITDQILHHSSRAGINRWRQAALQLPPSPFLGNFRAQRQRRIPQFLGYSQCVLPRPPDWGDHVHVTGYWFMNHAQDWQPPADLLNFLQAGSPPVCIGFGSMPIRQPEVLARTVARALELSGRRGILLGGWGKLGAAGLPRTILQVNSLPHDWLFPRVAAVVHHGGAGTTAAAFRAGVPAIVTPFFADQFFWAERVVALGVGPEYIPCRQITADQLAAAIALATSDPAIKTRAHELSQKIAGENGVEKTVITLEQALRVSP
jgi:sterol 3beta-glucosyltransferase